MSNYAEVIKKLEGFVTKYHTNELIKGCILFLSIGFIYFLFTLFLENIFWLGKSGRAILFWLFVAVEVVLLIRFVVIPLFKLVRLKKGINYNDASKIIGKHFTEVSDKLLNLIQLNNSSKSSDLLLASIDQKAQDLKNIPFRRAVNLTSNIKYVKYLIVPFVILAGTFIWNSSNWISDSYTRVVNYSKAYEPPAPFRFTVVNSRLVAQQNEDFTIKVAVEGDFLPVNVMINVFGESYFMKKLGNDLYEYVVVSPKDSFEFSLSSNEVRSKDYTLKVLEVPILKSLKMKFSYPSYIGKSDEFVKGTGNGIIPEGTLVSWEVNTVNADKVEMRNRDSIIGLLRSDNLFTKNMVVYSNFNYDLATSNKNISNYEVLSFGLKVIKDQYPEIVVYSKMDSLVGDRTVVYGRISDDYGLHKLRLVYYETDRASEKNYRELKVNKQMVDDFVYVFPSDIELKKEGSYSYYFEVLDNDVIHGYKSSTSKVFDYRLLSKTEKDKRKLKEQSNAISGLSKSIKSLEKQEKILKNISKSQKEKKSLDFKDKKKLDQFLDQQLIQEQKMKDLSNRLKKSLEKDDSVKKEEPFKDALKEKMERNEARLKKNEELLKEIQKLAEKMSKEELSEKLDDLAKENTNIKKNLEQLLELTKRFYVIDKHKKLSNALSKLAEKQEKLSDESDENNTGDKQDDINKQFEEFQKEMEELRKDNKSLKKPMKLDQKKEDENDIKEDLNKAKDGLSKQDKTEARKKQKSASQKMKQMSSGMQMEMQSAGQEQQMEDMEMLRQVLDNLVDFSLGQENLRDDFKGIQIGNPIYSAKLRRQSLLRESFIHIDDSLYALALRTPKITDDITEKLTNIEFSLDKSLELLAENQVNQGTSNQRYTITGANDLAYMLSSVLNQMQNSMPSAGKGKSGKNEFQLPDIIKKQGELSEKMKDGKKKGDKQGKNNGGKKGGQKGNQSKGNKGDNGSGEDGKGNTDKDVNREGNRKGKEGSEGKDGNGKGKNEEGEFGDQDDRLGELYEIYKQQQDLRNALADKLAKEGNRSKEGSRLLKKMEQVEQELLERGFDDNTISKMIDIKHELIKLDEAALEQGEDDNRESESNKKDFDNDLIKNIDSLKQYFNTTEILNRQVLPLQPNLKTRVQNYFRIKND